MEPKRTSEGTVREFFAALEAMDVDRFLKVWHERGVQVMPFALEGFPSLLDGREAVKRQYESLPKNFTAMRFPALSIYPTQDPGVFWATWRGEIQIKASGRMYNNNYAGMFKLRDGRLVEFHEYFNPIVLMQAFGDPEALKRNYNVQPEVKSELREQRRPTRATQRQSHE